MVTLVTGGTGFVGSNIVRSLAQRGHTVICLDLAGPDALDVPRDLRPGRYLGSGRRGACGGIRYR